MSRTYRSIITLLMGLAIFIMLPLLTWGIGDITDFIDNTARLGYLILVTILNTYAAFRIPEIGKAKQKGKREVKRQHYVVLFLQIMSLSIVLIAPYCDRTNYLTIHASELFRYLGLFLYTAGFLVMHWVEYHLGKQFTVEVAIHENHKLITDGPFHYLRHPRYLGIIVFFTGISFVFNSFIAIILVLLTMIVLLWRISDEEKLMHQEFGSEWESYCQNTQRLVPYLF